MPNSISIKLIYLLVTIACLILQNDFAQSADNSKRLFPVRVNGRYGYVDTTGKMVLKPIYDEAHEFREGLAGVIMGGQKKLGRDGYVFYSDGKFGYIDKTGNLVIPLGKYQFGRGFSEGLAEVRVNGCDGNNCTGFADRSGRLIINAQFSSVGEFHEGIAVVELPNRKKGVIDKTGKFIVPAIYDGLFDISEGVFVANMLAGTAPTSILSDKLPKYRTLFLDKKGSVIARPAQTVVARFSDGLSIGTIIVTVGSRDIEVEGFVDKTGNFVIDPKFYRVGSFVGGLAPASLGEKWGFIDKTGRFVIQPAFDSAERFVEGLAKVTVNGKTGFIDTTGKMVIEPRSWRVEGFVNGHAFVTEDGFTEYIDKAGKVLWKIKFEK